MPALDTLRGYVNSKATKHDNRPCSRTWSEPEPTYRQSKQIQIYSIEASFRAGDSVPAQMLRDDRGSFSLREL